MVLFEKRVHDKRKDLQMVSLFEDRAEAKKRLREKVQSLRGKLGRDSIAKSDEEIQLRLLQLPYFLTAESIFTYVSMEREPCTKEIIDTAFAMGKRVYVPSLPLSLFSVPISPKFRAEGRPRRRFPQPP